MRKKNEKLDRMKQKYENYQAPEELKGRMEEAMKKARNEGNGNLVFMWVRRTGVIAAAAMLSLVVLTNTNGTIAHALEKVPVIGAFTKVVTFRTFTDKSENFEAMVDVPQIEPKDTESGKELLESEKTVNKSVKEYTDELIARYQKDMKTYKDGGHEAIDTSYEVVTDTDKLFTLRIDTVIAQGSSDSFSKFYHIDKTRDKIIELKDLFAKDTDYISLISNEIIRQMREQMAADENKMYFIDQEDMGDEFDFKEIKADQNFYSKDSNLVIVFDKYEAAPGFMGQPEFTIPIEVIQSILAQDID